MIPCKLFIQEGCLVQKIEITDIVKKAKNKDKDAFTYLIRFYMKDMYRVALAILMNDEDVADAIQETILTCWEKIGTLRKEQYFKTWLTRILMNHCFDMRKEAKRTVDLKEWEEPFAEDSSNYELKEALASLDTKYSIVLTLFYGEGYHIKEIAKLLKIPSSTVRTRLQRGREQLAVYYGNAEVKRSK